MKKPAIEARSCSLNYLLNHPEKMIRAIRAGVRFRFTIGSKPLAVISQAAWLRKMATFGERVAQGEQMLVSYDGVPAIHLRKPTAEQTSEFPSLKWAAVMLPTYALVERRRKRRKLI